MAKTYEPIQTTTLASAASTVTLSSIPATYTDLILVCNLFSSGTTYSSIRFNGDTASNYSLLDVYGDGGGGTTSSKQTNGTSGGAGPSMGDGCTLRYQINNYANTTTYKVALGRNSNPDQINVMSVNTWRNTNAITSITLITSTADNWSIGSTLTLYGIKAA